LLRNSANSPRKFDDKRNRFKFKLSIFISVKNSNLYNNISFKIDLIVKRWHRIGGHDCLLKTQFSAMINIIVLKMKFAQCHKYNRSNKELLLIKSMVNCGLNYEDPKVAKSFGH